MTNNKVFSRDFLIVLSNWQRGWAENQVNRRIIANNLVKHFQQIPEEFKKGEGVCYRKDL